MLVSVGNYDDCALHIPSLGIQVLYNPGTVVAFSGQLFRHGVNEVDRARCCLAYYMRDNIHHWLRVPRSLDWVTPDNVRNALVKH